MKKEKDSRIYLLSNEEIEELYAVPILNELDRMECFALSDSEQAVLRTLIHTHSRVHFILQLGYFKAKRKLFDFTFQSVSADLNYVMSRYFPSEDTPLLEPSHNIIAQNNRRVLAILGFSAFDQESAALLLERAKYLARGLSKPRSILRELLVYTEQKKITLPGYSVFQKIIGKALQFEEHRLQSFITQNTPSWVTEKLNQLMSTKDQTLTINALRTYPKNFDTNQLTKEILKHTTYYPLYTFAKDFIQKLEISQQNIIYYASLVDFYDISRLNRFKPAKRYLYLLCYVHFRFQKMNDQLIQAFLYYVDLYEQDAKRYAQKKVFDNNRKTDSYETPLSRVFLMYKDEECLKLKLRTIKKKVLKFLTEEDIEFIIERGQNPRGFDDYVWEYHVQHYHAVIRNLRPLFMVIDFETDPNNTSLLQGAQFIKTVYQQGKSLNTYPIKDFPINFIPERLIPYIYRLKPNQTSKQENNHIDPYKYEFMIYSELAKNINSNLVYCNDAINYKSFEMDIGALKNWKQDKDLILKQLDCLKISTPMKEKLVVLKKVLEDLIVLVNARIENEENKDIKFKVKKDGTPYWVLSYVKKQDEFNNPFYNHIAPENISVIFDFVNKHCEFMKIFKHITTDLSNEENYAAIKACIIALGTGLGIYRMSHDSDLTYNSLIQAQNNYIRLETLVQTNNEIIDKIAELAIFKHYDLNHLAHGSVDGQKRSTRQDTFMSRYSKKYFALGKGVVGLSMIYNHIPINTRVIGAHEYEGHHLYDIVYNNTSGLELDRVSTDTHGSNNINFAFLDLLDIEFAPCYKSIRKKMEQLCGFKNLKSYKNYRIKPYHKINEELLLSEEDNIQKIFAAAMMKEITQSIIVKKMCARENNSRTKAALWEYNKIFMSIYMLKYINDFEYRQFVRAALNRGEAYNQLNASITLHGKSIRGSFDVDMAIVNECTRLIANIVLYYNAHLLSELMVRKEQEGNFEAAEFIRKLSIAASQHINFSGRHEFLTAANDLNIFETINQLDKILESLQQDNTLYKNKKSANTAKK
jgi:TnpA family transposase